MQRPQLLLGCCCAMVRTLLRSPTSDAATLPAFLPWPRWLVSCHSAHHARPALIPSVGDHSRCQTVPECAALPAPAASADRDRPLCWGAAADRAVPIACVPAAVPDSRPRRGSCRSDADL